MASLGDLNGDGVGDLAVGAWRDDDGGGNRGAVWILFLNTNGTVKAHQKISDLEGFFNGELDDGDWFGTSVASLDDLAGDRVGVLAVGAQRDDDGGLDRGAVWVLFLNTNGTVKSYQKISDTEGNFTGILDDSDRFGGSVSSLGDQDGDGVGDLVVGATGDDDGGSNNGAVWVLFLNPDGTVRDHQKFSDTQGGFEGTLDDSDFFGISSTSMGDLDGDGIADLAVGAHRDDDGGTDHGAVWVLFLGGVEDCEVTPEGCDVEPPTIAAIGPRYLEVIPAAGESEVALLVTSDDEPCVSLYVQAPETINGQVIGRLGADPVLLTPAVWGTVNVSDEEVVPGTSYGVQTELADATQSGPSTATTWAWADANNSGLPVDFDDILCLLDAFAGSFPGACSFFGADIEGGVTNVTIDFDDMLGSLEAFAGAGYFDAHVDPCP